MNLRNSHFMLILMAWMALPFSLKSQTNVLEDETADTTALSGRIEEVMVTAFRTPYNLFNTPAPVNLILPVHLDLGSALTPVEAINQVPGILMHNATLSTNRLTIRGIGTRSPYATNKIKAYFGEIPLTSGDGETTLEDLENASIQRVEIIKGPSSSLYGAGLGGTLLFQPKSVNENFVQHMVTHASFATWKNTLTAGIRNDRMYLFVLGSVLNSQGYRENNSTNRTGIMMHSEYHLSDDIYIEGLLRLTKMKAHIPSSVNLETFLSTPQKAAENWYGIRGYEAYTKGQLGLSLNMTPGINNRISVALFGNFRDADEPRPFNLLLEASEYAGSRGYYQRNITGDHLNLTITTGYELFRENYDWSTWSNENPDQALSDNKERRSYENLFLQAEASFNEKLFLSAGINGNLTRFDYTDNHQEDGDNSGRRSYDPVVSPRIGASYRLSDELSFFGNISHGFSTPTFEETLLPEGEINPAIKPETGWNLEAGMRTDFNNRLLATVSYYRIYVNNLLVARRTGEDAYVGVNAGKSLHPGLELDVRWLALNPGAYPSITFNGNATFANYHFRDFVEDDADYSGNLLPGTSRTTWLLGGELKPGRGFGIRAWHRFTGKMPLNDANTGYNDSFGITNMEVWHNNDFNRFHLELKAGIQNILDVHHAPMLAVNAPAFGSAQPRYYYPGNPRNYFFSMIIRWNYQNR